MFLFTFGFLIGKAKGGLSNRKSETQTKWRSVCQAISCPMQMAIRGQFGQTPLRHRTTLGHQRSLRIFAVPKCARKSIPVMKSPGEAAKTAASRSRSWRVRVRIRLRPNRKSNTTGNRNSPSSVRTWGATNRCSCVLSRKTLFCSGVKLPPSSTFFITLTKYFLIVNIFLLMNNRTNSILVLSLLTLSKVGFVRM